MNNILENYLSYLNEGSVGTALIKNASIGIRGSLLWGIVITPAMWLSWRGLNSALGKASRKCGTFTNGPGRSVCIARERIKILQQKLVLANKIASQCSKAKDPNICKQKSEIEIEKIKNRIEINKQKIKEEVGESHELNEFISVAAIGGVAVMLGAGMVMDKALSLAWRSALAIFSQASRKCGIYQNGPERKICMSKFKLISLNKRMAILKQFESTCGKQKNPQKCQENIQKKIETLGKQIQIQKDNILIYGKEMETEKREKEFKEAQKES